MATDMDIDMGLDIDIGHEYSTIELEQDTQAFTQPQPELNATPAPVDPADSVVTPHKVHLRGLDDLTSTDIKAFAEAYCSEQPIEKIEWIDDSSANLIYGSPEAASAALKAFAAIDELPPTHSELDLIPAKPFPNYPNTHLKIRLALVGDKKLPGARERSRFYLFNPEHERQERSRDDRGRRGDRRYRDRRDDYRSRAYDDRDRRRRSVDFDANMYDDDEATLARRSREPESESGTTSSGYGGQRGRKVRFTGVGKELFPEKVVSRNSGRLRDRSASPRRDNDGDLILDAKPSGGSGSRARVNDGGANRRKAQMLKDSLRASAAGPMELFPNKSGTRSGGFDATDSAADLFADKLRIPIMDGANDRPSTKPDLMSRITKPGEASASDANSRSSFKIRGTAKQPPQDGFSIKGLASLGQEKKELFPGKSSLNAGKELFADRLDGRGGRRQRAEDMFQ